MIIYGVFPLKIANKVIEEGRYVHQAIWRIHHWQAIGFPDHRPDLLCLLGFYQYAICPFGQRDCRCDQW